MADPDARAACDLLRAAATANWATPGRRGLRIDLTGAGEVMATGDLHGSRVNFKTLVRRAALADHPHRHLVLQELVHGGSRYDNGGDKSHLLVEAACRLKLEFPDRVHILLGNHELSEWTDRRIGKRGEEMNLLFRMGLAHAYGARAVDVAEALRTYYASLPLVIRTPNRVGLVHSVPPADALKDVPVRILEHRPTEQQLRKGGLVYAICWGRNYKELHAERFAQWLDVDLLVTGHEPSDEGWSTPNSRQLILDCCRAPAAYVIFETDRPVTLPDLLSRLKVF